MIARKIANITNRLLFLIVISLIVALLLKTLIFDNYIIISGSMGTTLHIGDQILISKSHYGARLPRSPFEISWVNVLFYLNKNARSKIDSVWWKYKRLRGISQVAQGDVVVFDFPGKNRGTFYVKRCVGLPGDSLEIKHGRVFCNQREVPLPKYAKAGLSESKTDSTPNTFPYNTNFLWSVDNFGPLIIPKKGMTIKLTKQNYILYKSAIIDYEGFSIYMENDTVKLKGQHYTSHTFRQNYYFMMGDNRHNSADSRYLGFIPEEGIVGKAVLILYNYNKGKLSWKRFAKKIE